MGCNPPYPSQIFWAIAFTNHSRAMWCGVVWCGVMWCGVVWCGVVCGVVWCVVWCGVILLGCNGVVWTQRNTYNEWCVMWCGVWCGVVWCDLVIL